MTIAALHYESHLGGERSSRTDAILPEVVKTGEYVIKKWEVRRILFLAIYASTYFLDIENVQVQNLENIVRWLELGKSYARSAQ